MRERSTSWARRTARPDSRRSCSSRSSMRLKSADRRRTSSAALSETSARLPGVARSTLLIVSTRRPIGSSRRRSRIELSRTTPKTASAIRSRPSVLIASLSRSRATSAATNAVRATSTVLTARTWVSSVRERISPLHRLREPQTLMVARPHGGAILCEVIESRPTFEDFRMSPSGAEFIRQIKSQVAGGRPRAGVGAPRERDRPRSTCARAPSGTPATSPAPSTSRAAYLESRIEGAAAPTARRRSSSTAPRATARRSPPTRSTTSSATRT